MKLETRNAIFRIAIRSTENQDTWILEGRLAGRVVDELRASWKRAVNEEPGRERAVDLVGVTFVDEYGEQALLEMMMDNADFVVRGVYMKTLLKSLSRQRMQEG
jgi:ABC-type transporter Mla MlaB component